MKKIEKGDLVHIPLKNVSGVVLEVRGFDYEWCKVKLVDGTIMDCVCNNQVEVLQPVG